MHHEAKGCIRLEETAWIKATMEQSHRKLCGRNQWTRMTLPEAVNFYFLRYTEQQQRRKNEWWEQSEYTFVVSKRLRSRHKHAAARLHSCRLAALFVSPLWFSLLCGRVWIRGDGGDQLVAICCHFVSWTRGGASAGQSRAIQRPVNQKVLHLLIGNTEGEQRDRDAPLIGGKMTEGFFLYHAVLLSQYPLRYRDTKLPPGSFHFCVFISECPNEPTDDI